jgi:hypothetical protein
MNSIKIITIAIISFIQISFSTCGQTISYKNGKIDFSLIIIAGAEFIDSAVYDDVKLILPFFIGLANNPKLKDTLKIKFDRRYEGKMFLEFKKQSFEIPCKDDYNYNKLKLKIGDITKIDIVPQSFLPAYTLTFRNRCNLNGTKDRLLELMDDYSNFDNADQLLGISGECIQLSIWTSYSNHNKYSVHMGIFKDSISAIKGIEALRLYADSVLIQKTTINVKRIERYFGHTSADDTSYFPSNFRAHK